MTGKEPVPQSNGYGAVHARILPIFRSIQNVQTKPPVSRPMPAQMTQPPVMPDQVISGLTKP